MHRLDGTVESQSKHYARSRYECPRLLVQIIRDTNAADAFYAESHRLDGTVVLHCCTVTQHKCKTLSSIFIIRQCMPFRTKILPFSP